ncbi:DUF4405 domain-containing protein [Marinifilum sp. N1E240]|uniref:DUF4405 domain-containing protein n=1 Tax=Marinifilum sp. N1E240 TaxID=2608082 RepID=UPI00128BC8D9|nr:DUF4405 domain-containing protein [Marinifilum sp. N1E240]MPQ46842.1 DUF4405 domain-containing protein [Marinifilum sp. N1E240]
MKRLNINFVIDLLLFLCLSLITGIGFLIKYVLLTGQETWAKYGDHVKLEFLGMDRHKWGYIHLILGFIMIVLIVLHVFYHWKLIKAMFEKVVGISRSKMFFAIAFILMCLFFILGPFMLTPNEKENKKMQEHYRHENRMYKMKHK